MAPQAMVVLLNSFVTTVLSWLDLQQGLVRMWIILLFGQDNNPIVFVSSWTFLFSFPFYVLWIFQNINLIFFSIAKGCASFSVTNGEVLGINTQKGSSVQVKCNDGYKLKSKEYQFRKCQDNGHWSGTGGNGAVVECLSKFLSCFLSVE